MMDTTITVTLPAPVFVHFQQMAEQQHSSVPEVVRELVLRDWLIPQLPPEFEAELAAFARLSDEVLWILARSTMPQAQQLELAHLNRLAQQRALTEPENHRQDILGELYDRTLVRRAQAAALLKDRGYDLSNPSVLQVA
jgi:hypothetical protein